MLLPRRSDAAQTARSARRPLVQQGLRSPPLALRQEAWARLARDLDPEKLEAITTEIGFQDVIEAAKDIVDGKIRGRVVVKMGQE